MKLVEQVAPFLGSWQGVNRLRMLPTDEYQESAAGATVSITAQDFVTIAYVWADGDTPQNGLLLLASSSDPDGVTAVWVDSWHSAPTWMTLAGNIGDDSVIRLTGSYAAPPGPDWGWQIHIDSGGGDGGRVTMHNVMPGRAAYQVVETVYDRRGEG
ncbi:MAG: DUF1579 family protein [Jiangellaceae bacterium]